MPEGPLERAARVEIVGYLAAIKATREGWLTLRNVGDGERDVIRAEIARLDVLIDWVSGEGGLV